MQELLQLVREHIDAKKADAAKDLDSIMAVRNRLEGEYLNIYLAVYDMIQAEDRHAEAVREFAALSASFKGGALCQSANSLLLLYDCACQVHPMAHIATGRPGVRSNGSGFLMTVPARCTRRSTRISSRWRATHAGSSKGRTSSIRSGPWRKC